MKRNSRDSRQTEWSRAGHPFGPLASSQAINAPLAPVTPIAPRLRGGWLSLGLVIACLLAQPAIAQTTAQTAPSMAAQADTGTGDDAELPSFAQVHSDYRSSEHWLLDRNGQRIQRIRTDFTARKGDWVGLADVSPALLHAVLLTEDKNFYAHSGVDWSAVGAAAWANLWNERTRGASTITMQLAGLLNDSLRSRSGGRSWGQKWRQLWASRELEAGWSKAEILEAYLNLVPFRGEIIGIDALSRSLFGKAPHGLDQREAAIAAALLRAPNAATARVSERACQILQQAQSPWGEDCKALSLYSSAALRNRHFEPVSGPAPHFARYAMRQWSSQHPNTALPEQLPSSLDRRIQLHAQQALELHLGALQGKNVQDGAVLVLDNASGEILAWVGSSGQALSQADQVDAVVALRQPGSTLKPFLYAQAIAERRLTAASLLHDSPAKIPTQYGIYAPENYDQGYKGWVSVRQALGSSLNIPAVRTLLMVTPERFAAQLRALGFALPEPAGYYGYSLALGGVDVSLLQLTNAYRTLANAGVSSPVATQRITRTAAPAAAETIETNSTGATTDDTAPASESLAADHTRILPANVAYIVGDMLSDRHARLLTFGTDSQLATRFWSAVKTGTSKDMRDNWAMGYTPHFTIGVWVGNADGSPMQDVSGISGAAPVWASMAAWLHQIDPAPTPQPPADLVRQAVRYTYDEPDQPEAETPTTPRLNRAQLVETARDEWFVPGTEQSLFVLSAAAPASNAASTTEAQRDTDANGVQPRISQPLNGTILALDPDIPPNNQMLRIASSAPAKQLHWWVNNTRVTGLRDASHWYWPPQPGQFTLELRSADGKTVFDQVRIEVRGASLKTGS